MVSLIFLMAVLVLPFVVLIVVLTTLAPAMARRERARTAALHRWAMANGWTFTPSCQPPWTAHLPGRNHRGLGATLIGQIGGRRVIVSEYSYSTTSSSGDTTTTSTHHFIVVAVLLDRMHPPVSVRRAPGALAAFARKVFGQSPAPTGDPVFDSFFRIDSADPDHARSLVGPQLMHAHVTGGLPPWQIVGSELLTCTPTSGRIHDPNLVFAYAGPTVHVAELLGR